MKFSGSNFRLMPTVSGWAFSFSNTFLDTVSGVAAIGFSGSGNGWSLFFKSGKIYDSDGNFVYTYNPYEAMDISGEIEPEFYRYGINGNTTRHATKNSYRVNKWFANTTGANLYVEPKINITGAGCNFVFQSNTYSDRNLTGRIDNGFDSDFRVFGTQYLFLENDNRIFSASISGQVPSHNSLTFELPNIDAELGQNTARFLVQADTTIGTIEQTFNVLRLNAVTGNMSSLSFSEQGGVIGQYFQGSGLPNAFVYDQQTSGASSQSLYYSKRDAGGTNLAKTLSLQISPEINTGSYNYTGVYPTGHSVTNSGFYSHPTTVEFLEYSHVTGADFNAGNLFSLACGSSIPALFLSASGYGQSGSGSALLKSVRISLYGSTNFYTITGFSFANAGTGYNYNPFISLLKPVDCIDVPAESGNQYIYKPFSGSGVLKRDAGYLWGELMSGTGAKHISGENRTGMVHTGLWITNAGSGYNSGDTGYVPRYIVHRHTSDIYGPIAEVSGFNASGSFSFNSSQDTYSFTNNWSVSTGLFGSGMYPISLTNYGGATGYSGQISLDPEQNGVGFYVYFNQTNFAPEPSVRLAAKSDDGIWASVYVTGRNSFYTATGAHKIDLTVAYTGDYFEF